MVLDVKLVFVLLPLLLSELPDLEVDACSCFAITRREAICGSQWSRRHYMKNTIAMQKCNSTNSVSLVNIVGNNGNVSNNRLIEYTVEHLKIFKTLRRQPFQSTIDEELSDRVRTPKFSASCGVTDLKADHQYLLAGRFGEGKELLIFSCGSIPAQDGGFNPPPGVLEWDRVPKRLRGALLSQDFPNCTALL